jgi:hypothetical protein
MRRIGGWLGIGSAQIKRARRGCRRIGGGAEPGHPTNVGRRLRVNPDRWRCVAWPSIGKNLCGIAN